MLDHNKVHVISLWQENICTCLKQARIGCTLFAARERYDASLQRSSLATVAGLNNDGSSPGVSTLREGLLEHCHVHEISSLEFDLLQCLVVIISNPGRVHLTHDSHDIPAISVGVDECKAHS